MLVSSTDGVGTKLLVADAVGKHDTIGIDLVAMTVNDIVVCGAKPLFFLDYFASGRLDLKQAKQVVKGIHDGCEQAGCVLLGGETAELPGIYAEGIYDLAGFGVGIVDKAKALSPSSVRVGDQLIGIASSGLHSNGYSLARKVAFDIAGLKAKQRVKGLSESIGMALLNPTRIYVKSILEVLKRHKVRSIAHITGGGIPGNLNRALAKNTDALVDASSWPIPPIFHFLAENGPVAMDEMFRTFNMGLGMILVVPPASANGVMKVLERMGEEVYQIGEVVKGNGVVVLE
jgi:phosphoribosylformylglycinamidine cyclo-ligase